MKKRFGLAVGSVFLALCLMSGCGAAPKASMDGAWAPAGGDSLPWISEGENYQYDSVIEQGFTMLRRSLLPISRSIGIRRAIRWSARRSAGGVR